MRQDGSPSKQELTTKRKQLDDLFQLTVKDLDHIGSNGLDHVKMVSLVSKKL